MNMLHRLALAACVMAWGAQGSAATLQLSPSATTVQVGDVFTVAVAVAAPFDGTDPLEEIIAFGFDAFVSNATLAAFTGAVVAAPFDDDSGLLPVDVAGSVFPGIVDDGSGGPLVLALLEFEALAPGLVGVGTLTDVLSNPNHGLFYALADAAELSGSVAVTVTPVVPVPAAAWLLASGVAALGGVRRLRQRG